MGTCSTLPLPIEERPVEAHLVRQALYLNARKMFVLHGAYVEATDNDRDRNIAFALLLMALSENRDVLLVEGVRMPDWMYERMRHYTQLFEGPIADSSIEMMCALFPDLVVEGR